MRPSSLAVLKPQLVSPLRHEYLTPARCHDGPLGCIRCICTCRIAPHPEFCNLGMHFVSTHVLLLVQIKDTMTAGAVFLLMLAVFMS